MPLLLLFFIVSLLRKGWMQPATRERLFRRCSCSANMKFNMNGL